MDTLNSALLERPQRTERIEWIGRTEPGWVERIEPELIKSERIERIEPESLEPTELLESTEPTELERAEQAESVPVIVRLKGIVAEIIGADAVEFLDFTEDSAFIRDLEMDSIKLIHLAERVNDIYGEQADFIGWLSAKPIKEILALTVGDVVHFVEDSA